MGAVVINNLKRQITTDLTGKTDCALLTESIRIVDHLHDKGLLSIWQPIETAPLDGSYIILYNFKTGRVQEGKFYRYGTQNVWRVRCSNVWPIDYVTHWMPFPKAPKGRTS